MPLAITTMTRICCALWGMAKAPEPLLRRLPLHTLDHNHDGIYAALREAGLVE